MNQDVFEGQLDNSIGLLEEKSGYARERAQQESDRRLYVVIRPVI